MVKFSIRPVFVGSITLLSQLPAQLFFTLWCGAFFGGLASFTGLFPGGFSVISFAFGAAAFIGFPAVVYTGKKLNYSRTEYPLLSGN